MVTGIWNNFVKLGIHQGFGISVTLPRLIGEQQAAHDAGKRRRQDDVARGLRPGRAQRVGAVRLALERAEHQPATDIVDEDEIPRGMSIGEVDEAIDGESWCHYPLSVASEGVGVLSLRLSGSRTSSKICESSAM